MFNPSTLACVDASYLENGLLRTGAGDLTLGVSVDSDVLIQEYDSSNQPVGAPVAVATVSDLSPLEVQLSTLTASYQSAQTTIQLLQSQITQNAQVSVISKGAYTSSCMHVDAYVI